LLELVGWAMTVDGEENAHPNRRVGPRYSHAILQPSPAGTLRLARLQPGSDYSSYSSDPCTQRND
jgi:hypothetical protein